MQGIVGHVVGRLLQGLEPGSFLIEIDVQYFVQNISKHLVENL